MNPLLRSMVGCCVVAALLLAGCKGRLADSSAENNADERKMSSPTISSDSKGLSIDGEHFTVRTIIDHQQGNLPVATFVAPQSWRDQSQVIWNYANYSNPVTSAVDVQSPSGDEVFHMYPSVDLFALRPDMGFYRPGQNVGGQIFAHPMAAASALLTFVQNVRHGVQHLQIVGSKDLPDLPAVLQLPPTKTQTGIGLKVTYDLNGKPTEEEFYAVYYKADIPYDGPQGRTWQTNWGLMALHSFRAPLGTLDKRRPVFAAMAKSIRRNPAWQQRLKAINAYLAEQFNRQLQAGYNQIAAAGALSRQISANSDAFLASVDRSLQASRTSEGSGATVGRSSNDKFDDYIRGVDTTDDPYYGTSQHSSNESYHWTDGYGTYRNSNDASYNPNQNENGNWQLMQQTR
jgi:hypothetical protein